MSGAVAFGLAMLTGCGGSGSGGGGSAAARGPANAAAFSGTTITINPTLKFLAGGTLEYTNSESSNAFPVATNAPGTYTYSPSADFTTGTLTLTFTPAIGTPAISTMALTLSNFTVQSGNVTAFRATFEGTPFNATVTNGTLASAPEPNDSNPSTDQPASAIPEALRGSRTLVFTESAAGSNIPAGSSQDFTIGESTLTAGSLELSDPVFRGDSTSEWIFTSGSLEYALSSDSGGNFNEINVTGPNGTPFYGSFTEAAETGD